MTLALVVLAFTECEAVTYYTVGDGRGWTTPPNITAGFYDDSAANKSIEAGNVLRFEFNGTHSFAAVSKKEYDNCAKVSPIYKASTGWSGGYKLSRGAGMYFFICTIDSHCEAGQKMAVNVTATTSASFATWSPPSTLGALSTAVCAFTLFLRGH
ncbi:stellacyanin-like [Rhodamnia argentea]|uniref:Stellacyanin-like n=1 Tax=Rhodamnia argentea TaxID=178133 RepID=A0ABM3HBQ6_9MYRT|nr:stellacyanin-like [Rhodamnia argentea]